MKTARFKSTSRASRIGGTTRTEHRAGEGRPMPRGSRPSTAASRGRARRTRSEIVIWTCRMLHLSRAASAPHPVTVLANNSSSQRRPRAIERPSVARVSDHDRLVLRVPWKKTPMKRRRDIIVPASVRLTTVDRFARTALADHWVPSLPSTRPSAGPRAPRSDDVVAVRSRPPLSGDPEMLADGAFDERLDLPPPAAGAPTDTPGCPCKEG